MKYTEAELQIVTFEAEDVITTSNPVYDDNGNEIL